MTDTPRRLDRKVEVLARGVEHEESATVPGGTPATNKGVFWVRSGGDPMFTGDDATDYVLNLGSQWQRETASTTGASATNTIATPVSALADGEQTVVEVFIFGVDDADATNTYFRHETITYYRDGGTATQWTIEESGRDQRRGTFPTTLTAGLTTSTNAIIVNADTTGIGGAQTVNWTSLFLTRGSIEAGVGVGSTPGAYPILTTTTVVAATTISVGDYQRYDPSGGTFQIDMPATATRGDMAAIKNVTSDTTAITLSGNGNNVEDPATFTLSASVSVTGDGIGLVYQFDGTQWLIV